MKIPLQTKNRLKYIKNIYVRILGHIRVKYISGFIWVRRWHGKKVYLK